MKSRMILIACLVFAALAIAATGSVLAQRKTGKPQVITLKATKSTTRGEETDPNIKGEETNDPNAPMSAPANKGGSKTRGDLCEVRFDNRTPWIIKLYVDGNYRGAMLPYGDSIAYAWPGETRVYARANFNDGSYLSWGPKDYDCGSNQYIKFRMDP